MADCIFREAVVKYLEDCSGGYDYIETEKEGAINDIKAIPAADVRPVVKARWEDETGYIFTLPVQRVYCPACKSYAYFCPITTKNFCPNCSVEMEEGVK